MGKSMVIEKYGKKKPLLSKVTKDDFENIKYDPIDYTKESTIKVVVCEAKIKMQEDRQEFYKIEPFIELRFPNNAPFRTKIAKVGAFTPRFD